MNGDRLDMRDSAISVKGNDDGFDESNMRLDPITATLELDKVDERFDVLHHLTRFELHHVIGNMRKSVFY